MIRNGYVQLYAKDVQSGEMLTEMPVDLALLLLEQARTLEDFRILWFGMCKRTTRYVLKGQAAGTRARAAHA